MTAPENNDTLLPDGQDVPFAEIEGTLARLVREGRRPPARAFTGTVIVVGPSDRLASAADALEQLREASGVRAILISEGEHTAPVARVTDHTIAINGLAPRFLNNAVAALRLSSLPAMVWWRGGSIQALDGLAVLADRLVLDVPSPQPVWDRAAQYFEKTALTDLRWTRLTRWRSALAHMFDLPRVRAAAAGLERLSIAAPDRDAARLFAGWLRARLRWDAHVPIDITDAAANGECPAALASVTLSGTGVKISLEVKPGRSCLVAVVEGTEASAQVVPLGDGTLASLIAEELGVRTRDLAFEQALASAREIPA